MNKTLTLLLATSAVSAVISTAAMPVAAETLTDSLVMAYETNPDLQAQRAALRAADEGVAQAMSGFLPTVAATGQISKQNRFSSSDAFDRDAEGNTIPRLNPDGSRARDSSDVNSTPKFYEARVDQPLFQGFQTVSSRKQAKSLVRAARAQLQATEQTVFLDTVTVYLDVLRDEAVLRLNQNNVEVLTRQLQATQDRFRVGEITRTDVAQSEARLAGAVSSRISAEADLAASRSRYRRFVGQQSGTLEKPPAAPALPATLDGALEIARGNNPSIAIAKYNEEAARFAVNQAVGALAPTVSGFASINRFEGTSAFGASTVDSTTTTKQIGVQVRIPLFQGGGEYADIRRARQVDSQRRLEILSAERQANARVRTAWDRHRAAQAAIKSNMAQVRANTIALDGVRQEAAVGSRTTLDVLDAEQELLDARVQLVRAERDEYVASFELLAATGQLNVTTLELPARKYDPEEHYRKVKNKFIGWGSSND
ncbi:MAG: TolC family outer membrane protein [Sphingomonadales bacterium]